MIGTMKLKLATEEAHQSLEKVLSFLHTKPSLEGYRRFLSKTYAFLAEMEPRLRLLLPFLESEGRFLKASWLQMDLNTLKLPLPPIAPHHWMPKIETEPQAFGALYVFEGSTLGGTLLRKSLLASFSNIPVHYVSSYGDLERRAKWDSFRTCFEDHWQTWSLDEKNLALESATATFQKFEAWQQEGLP
jgi:heme oxygenase (biliverdin-IX-beta and delta-forming)